MRATKRNILTLEYIPASMLPEIGFESRHRNDHMRIMAMFPLLMLLAISTAAQSASDSHAHDVDTRGDKAMGFEHTKTTHHFLLNQNGGVIRVEAKEARDVGSRAFIRAHLTHIAKAFSQGDFQIPMLVHDQTPPGTEVMKRLKHSIQYCLLELPTGGEVVIASSNPQAIAAIHQFLRFQIKDHRTGDSLKISE